MGLLPEKPSGCCVLNVIPPPLPNSVVAMPPQNENTVNVKSVLQRYARLFNDVSNDMQDEDDLIDHYTRKLERLRADTTLKTRAQMARWQNDIEHCQQRLEKLKADRRRLV